MAVVTATSLTATALKGRARRMLLDMTERSRWIYALPRLGTMDKLAVLLAEHGVARVADDAGGTVVAYGQDVSSVHVVAFDSRDLEVVLLEGSGSAVVPVMQAILETTGFVPQSELWRRALALGEPDCARSLKILAHMVVAWDDDWVDLFLLHLASPDAISRREAVLATTLAAMVARDVGPALTLLSEAHGREKFPQLGQTMAEAIRILEAYDGRALDLTAIDRELLSPPSPC